MSVLSFVTYLLIFLTDYVSPKRCCPPGQHLHGQMDCPPDAAALRSWEPTKMIQRPPQFDFFEHFNESEVCESQQSSQYVDVTRQGNWGLPPCPVHSFVTLCNVGISNNDTLIHYYPHNSTSCYQGNCYSEVNNNGTKAMIFPLKDACVDDKPSGSKTAVVCPCLSAVCIRKCCPKGELLDDSAGVCIRNNTVPDWRPVLQGSKLNDDYFLLSNSFPPRCEQTAHLLKIPFDYNKHSRCFSEGHLQRRQQFIFNLDGSVKIGKYNFIFKQDEYCGEHTLHEDGSLILNNLLYCLPKEATQRPEKFDIYGVLLLIGGCFLALTVVISCYLPELRGNLYHKVTICHNVALMLASFVWGASNLMTDIEYPLCVTFSLIIQFTFLASFFWMNVMCIDIALAFKHLRSLYGPGGEKGRYRFLLYSLYAWGCPSVITAITAAMELSLSVPYFIQRPGFGCQNCGFNQYTYALLIYFYGPMIFILLFNLFLFIMTILKIRQVEKQTAILKSKGRLHRTLKCCPDTQRFILFTKMFVLMGLTWATEIIGWCIGGPSVFWYFPDLINFLRAIFLFVVFVGKKSVWSSLRQKITHQRSSLGSQTRRSKSSSVERREAEIERRGRILAKQITQTFRVSHPDTMDSNLGQM